MNTETTQARVSGTLDPIVGAMPFPNDGLSHWAANQWLDSQEGLACWSDAMKIAPESKNGAEWLRNRLRSAFRAGAEYGRVSANAPASRAGA